METNNKQTLCTDNGYKKATLRTTGETVYVRPTTRSIQSRVNIYEEADGREIVGNMLVFAPEVDWGQRRYEIATAAMQALIGVSNGGWSPEYRNAEQAVKYADALIEELKRKTKEQ